MNLTKIFTGISIFLICASGYTQVAISEGPADDPDPAAILDLQSTTKGFLTPRMAEAQKNAISNPAKGLIIYQTDGAEGFYFNSGTPSAPQWNKLADNSGPQGYWTQSGNDIYYNTGKVGIGTSSPSVAFEVNGPGWFNDSVAVDGSPGRLYLNGATGHEAFIRWAYEGSTKMQLRYRLADGIIGEPLLMLNSDIYRDIWGVTRYGRIRQDYRGDFQAYVMYSSAPRSALYIDNDNNFSEAKCISVALSDLNASASSAAIASWNNGEGSAIYAENEKYDNFSYLGTDLYGVYGEHGTSSYWGTIGTATAGVFGRLGDGQVAQTLTPGDYAVKGLGVETNTQEGVGYGFNATIGGVLGYNTESTAYSFGVAGYVGPNFAKRSGAVLGAFNDAAEWGALAYRANTGSSYGGYFTSAETSGNGDNISGPASAIGIGVWGDLFGAKITGRIYGLYTEGTNYGLYARGDVYRTGADVHMQQDEQGNRQVMYTVVAADMIVQTYGIGQLDKGKAGITFDRNFAEVVSESEPIIVTVTPIGKSKGIYLEEVDGSGFNVAENDRGKSSVQFSWIAIGKRKGFENKILPEDVIAADYDEKIEQGLTNDNDPNAIGTGLYYQDGKLVSGQIQRSSAANVGVSEDSMKKQKQISIENPEEADGDIR